MSGKSAQRAGRDSQQIQVAGDLNLGVTASEAMDIARYVAQDVAAKFTAEALEKANARIDEFDARLVDILAAEQALHAMQDPAFQILVKKAQRGAAASGRESDYDRLSHLLSKRAHEEDRKKRAAADLAVQVVDLVDDEALAGLTASRVFQLAWVLDGRIAAGLDQYERWAAALVEMPLPEGDEWIDHLESLGLVRTSRSEHFNPSVQVIRGQFGGYMCPGVETESEAHMQLVTAMAAAGITHPLGPHELHEGHTRFLLCGDHGIEHWATHSPITIPDIDEFKEIARTFTGYGAATTPVDGDFLKEFDARPTLRTLRRWWDSPRVAFRYTPPGSLLAAANSTRLMRQAGLGSRS